MGLISRAGNEDSLKVIFKESQNNSTKVLFSKHSVKIHAMQPRKSYLLASFLEFLLQLCKFQLTALQLLHICLHQTKKEHVRFLLFSELINIEEEYLTQSNGISMDD